MNNGTKISELPLLSTLSDNDILAGVDTSENVTSKVELVTLKNYIDTNTQYTAGTNIDITNNVISAPNVYNKSETDEQIKQLQDELDAVSTIYNAFPTVDDEDESMTLNDTAESKFKKITLQGNTSQETTTGINILAPTTATNPQSSNGITRTTNPDGSVTLTGTATANSYLRISNDLTLESNTNYTTYNANGALPSGVTLYYNNNENIGQVYTGTNITPGNTLKSYTTGTVTGTVSIAVLTQSGTTINATIYPMLVKGTYTVQTMPNYETFTGGNPAPNPDYPEDVEVVSGDNTIDICGKNLFDKENPNVINAYFTSSITAITSNENNRLIYVKCKPNTTYTIRRKIGSIFACGYTNELPNTGVQVSGISTTYVSIDTNYFYEKVSTGSNAKYLVSRLTNVEADTITLQEIYDSLQIEESETPSTYEAYIGNTYPIYLGTLELCKIGTYQDYIYKDNGSWYLHKEIGKVVLDGSESDWGVANSGTAYWYYRLSYITGVGNTSSSTPLINYYPFAAISNSNTTQGLGIVSGYFRIRYGTEDTIQNYKTWLNSNNLTIYYPLATSTSTEITDTTLLEQLEDLKLATSYEGQTNISQENNDKPFILDVEAIKKLS